MERTVPARRMLVIVNPYATTVSDRLKHLVVYALQGRYEVDAVDTQAKGHATELCREAAHEGYDVVVAFGGDGTVNEAVNGLVGSGTAFTCLPGGRTNVFCRMLGIPNDVVDATEHLLRVADVFTPRQIDLGHRQRPRLRVLGRRRARRPRGGARRRAPAPEGAARRVVLHLGGALDVHAPLPAQAAPGSRSTPTATTRTRACSRSCSAPPLHVLRPTGRSRSPRAPSWTTGCSPASCSSVGPLGDADGHLAGLRHAAADGRPPPRDLVVLAARTW